MYGPNGIFLFHALVVGPLLMYTGYAGQKIQSQLLKKTKQTEPDYTSLFSLVTIFGIGVSLYHGQKLVRYSML
jgi:hypothetical protein